MSRRREIWWVDFGEPRGSAPALRRPALVVSADRFNRSRIATVQVTPITTNTRRAAMPGSVFVARGVAGRPRDSVVQAHQVATVDRSHLDGLVGVLPQNLMAQVDDALRLVLGP